MLEPMRDRTLDLETALALADRHPRFVATVLAAAGCVIIAGATSVVSVLALPALLLSAPWAAPLPCGLVRVGNKTRQTAALLAICGGALGAHRFYLSQPFRGLLYLVAFWTLVPAIIGLLDGLRYLAMSDQAFDLKHNVRLTS